MTLDSISRDIHDQRRRLMRERQSGVDREAQPQPDTRDMRDPSTLGEVLLSLRARAPKALLSKLYDRHRERLEAL